MSWIEKAMDEYEDIYGWDSEEEKEAHFRELFETAVSYMDDEIREELHAEWTEWGDSVEICRKFLKAYEERHYAKYSEEFMTNY